MEFRDRAVLLGDALVLADLHVGMAGETAEGPAGVRSTLVSRLRNLLEAVDVEEVVVAGDLLHRFSGVPTAVAETVDAIDRTVREGGADMVVTPGNHDAMLAGIWDGPMPDEHRLGEGTVVCHGHQAPAVDADSYLVGHDHPTLRVEGRKRPCHLVGEQDAGEIVMLPAFGPLVPGVAVNRLRAASFQSPLITDTDALRPVVVDEDAGETLEFPPLGQFRERL